MGTPGRTLSPALLRKFHLCRTRRKHVGPRKNTDLKDNDSLGGGHSRVSENFVHFSFRTPLILSIVLEHLIVENSEASV